MLGFDAVRRPAFLSLLCTAHCLPAASSAQQASSGPVARCVPLKSDQVTQGPVPSNSLSGSVPADCADQYKDCADQYKDGEWQRKDCEWQRKDCKWQHKDRNWQRKDRKWQHKDCEPFKTGQVTQGPVPSNSLSGSNTAPADCTDQYKDDGWESATCGRSGGYSGTEESCERNSSGLVRCPPFAARYIFGSARPPPLKLTVLGLYATGGARASPFPRAGGGRSERQGARADLRILPPGTGGADGPACDVGRECHQHGSLRRRPGSTDLRQRRRPR